MSTPQQRLKGAMENLILPLNQTFTTGNDVRDALDRLGVTTFDDFLHMKEDTIENLIAVSGADIRYVTRRRMIIAINFYNEVSYKTKMDVDIAQFTRAQMDIYASTIMDPNKQPKPWKTRIRDEEATHLRDTKKNHQKPNASVFPKLREEKQWLKWFKECMVLLRVQGLSHTINPHYTPPIKSVYEIECTTTIGILQVIVLLPKAKAQVEVFVNTTDSAKCWEAIVACMMLGGRRTKEADGSDTTPAAPTVRTGRSPAPDSKRTPLVRPAPGDRKSSRKTKTNSMF